MAVVSGTGKCGKFRCSQLVKLAEQSKASGEKGWCSGFESRCWQLVAPTTSSGRLAAISKASPVSIHIRPSSNTYPHTTYSHTTLLWNLNVYKKPGNPGYTHEGKESFIWGIKEGRYKLFKKKHKIGTVAYKLCLINDERPRWAPLKRQCPPPAPPPSPIYCKRRHFRAVHIFRAFRAWPYMRENMM